MYTPLAGVHGPTAHLTHVQVYKYTKRNTISVYHIHHLRLPTGTHIALTARSVAFLSARRAKAARFHAFDYLNQLCAALPFLAKA